MEINYFIAAAIVFVFLIFRYKSMKSIVSNKINNSTLKSYLVKGTDSCIVNSESKKEAIETYSHFNERVQENDLIEIDVNMPSMFRSCIMSKDQIMN